MDDCLVAYGQNGEPMRPQQGFPAAADRSRLRRNLQHQVAAANQGGGPVLHDVQRLRPHLERRGSRRVDLPVGTEIGDHVSFRRTAAARSGIYQITGLAWSGGGAFARWKYPPTAARPGRTPRFGGRCIRMAHTRFGMDWKWDGQECVLQSRCTDELGQVQPTRAQLAKFFNVPPDYYKTHGVPGHRQYHPTVEGGQRWERSQCDCLGFSCR